MRVALYLVVPRHKEYEPLRLSASKLRRAARRMVDRASWRLGGRELTSYAWPRYANTNKGDIAIREAVKHQLCAARPAEEIEFEEFGWGELDESAVRRLNADCDLFVVAGSGYFHFDEGGKLAARLTRDAGLLRRLRVPKLAYGVGVNAPPDLNLDEGRMPVASQTALRDVLDCLDAIGVRDEPSQAVLSRFSRAPVTVVGDPALTLAQAEAANVRRDGPLRIGLNAAVHDGMRARELPAYLSALLPVVRRLQETRAPSWFYFVHSDEERGVPELLRAAGVPTTTVDGPIDAMLAAYAALDCHICEMLHSSILAISVGVPAVSVGYDAKHLAFFSLLGAPELCVPMPELSEARLRRAVETALDGGERLREALLAAKARLAEEQAKFLAEAIGEARVRGAA